MTERRLISSIAPEVQAGVLNSFGRFDVYCQFNRLVAERTNGWLYLTKTHSVFGSYFYIAVAQIETSNKGQIINISSPSIFEGEVKDVFDTRSVAGQLKRKYKISGWDLVENFHK